jgi:hypothetical protein
VPLLATTLGVAPGEIFYSWMRREFPGVEVPVNEGWRLQFGQVAGTDWQYFFHGWECDLHHEGDGRLLRVEFGPRGRYDIVGPFAVLELMRTSKASEPALADLKAHLTPDVGGHARAVQLWERLEKLALVEPADPDLLALARESTTTLPSGHRCIALPASLCERERDDVYLAGRQVLSELGSRLLEGY